MTTTTMTFEQMGTKPTMTRMRTSNNMNRSMLLAWGLVTCLSVLGHRVQAVRTFHGLPFRQLNQHCRARMAFVQSVPRGGDMDSFSVSDVEDTSGNSDEITSLSDSYSDLDMEEEDDEEKSYSVTGTEPSSLDVMDGPYAAVSIVVVGKKREHAASTSATTSDDDRDVEDKIQAGTMLIPTREISSLSSFSLSEIMTKAPCWTGRGLWKENTPQLWESLAVMSDVLVVVVDEASIAATPTIDPTLVQGIRSGLLRRIFQSNLSKGRLLVVAAPSDTTTESVESTTISTTQDWASWKDRMVTVDLASVMSETLMETVEFVPVSRMRQVLTDYLLEVSAGDDQTNDDDDINDINDDQKTGRTVDVVDAKSFSAVLQQVYESVGGTEDVLLQEEQQQEGHPTLIPNLRVDREEILASTTTTATTSIIPVVTEALVTKTATTTIDPVVTEAPVPELDTAAVATKTDTDKDDTPAVATTNTDTDTDEDEDATPAPPALSLVESALESAQAQLDDLEAQQEQVWLDDGALPLEFSTKANSILEKLDQALAHVPDSLRGRVTQQVGDRLQRLYQQQTQSLRDHFGRMYETALDHSDDADQWSSAAAKVTDRFRKAAQQAVPKLAREGGIFRNMDLEYVGSMQGLVSDMMEATESRQTLEDALAEGESEQIDGGSKPKRPAKWYEKLAARALVLSVNYLQGWLAWQGIKRAAIERDQNMPKFPLF